MNVTGLNVPMDFKSLSSVEQIYRSVLIPLSFVINTGVLWVIIYSRQLHYPRHVFWAALALLNNFSTVHWIFELLGIVLHLSFACRSYVLNAGMAYTLLLNCLCLTTIDRYTVIAHYDWYKENVSNRMVICALVCSTFVTYAMGTSPFWTGSLSLSSCTVNLYHVHWLLIWDLILGVVCVILDFKILTISRALVRSHVPSIAGQLPIAMTFVQPSRSRGASSRVMEEPVLCKKDHIDHGTYRGAQSHGRKRCNRLETRAALSFSINTLPFWLCTFPITLAGISLYWCVYLQLSCPVVVPTNRHLKHLFFIHHIYNPTTYVLTTKEFQRALVRFVSRFKK